MNIQNLIAATTIGLTTLGVSVAPVLAETQTYSYNQHVGNVWVGEAKVYNNNIGGVTATAEVNMPTCGAFSYLTGYIKFDYVADDGGYFYNYAFYVEGYEGYRNVLAYVNVPNNMSSNGTLYLTDETYCFGL
jgi:hypothetical protein